MVSAWRTGPGTVAQQAPFVRDAMHLGCLSGWQLLSLLPCVAVALHQSWGRESLTSSGLQLLVVFVTGSVWQRLFGALRKHQSSEGMAVTALLFCLMLPASLPHWQAALGISFGVVVGKELFGGTGRNFVHPALVGFVFLYHSYPGHWSEVVAEGESWWPGVAPMALAAIAGAALLLHLRLISWRILVGAVLGLLAGAAGLCALGGEAPGFPGLAWYQHATVGSFAFGVVFLATDPVTSPMTDPARWMLGVLVGVVTALLRFVHPTLGEGALFAVLFASIVTPLLDHAAIAWHVRRRRLRHG